jgi:peptidoglycan/LPS O-acetylase OafA/YrhL
VLAVAIQVASLVIYRISFPYTTSDDFRYIYPVMPLLAILLGMLAERCEESGLRQEAWLGKGLGMLFAAVSIVFILKQHL